MTTTTHPQKSSPIAKKRNFQEITNDEVQLYDRQIRLWGLEAQSRMRNARILVIGVSGLSNEVLKNIVLAGVGHVTILDSSLVQERDLGCQFLLRKENIGENKAVAAVSKLTVLNPRVDIKSDQSHFEEKSAPFFKDFDLVVMTKGSPDQIIKFWASQNMGFHSFIFADLIQHDCVTETKRTGIDGEVVVKTNRSDIFVPLSTALSRKYGYESSRSMRKWKRKAHPLYFAILVLWEFYKIHKKWPDYKSDEKLLEGLKEEYLNGIEVDSTFVSMELLLQVAKCRSIEYSSSCAIVGGFLGQEILKVLAQKEIPFNNMFLHDAWEAIGFRMHIS